MKLIQLPNGDWIRPDTVTAIIPMSDGKIIGKGTIQRVRIHHADISLVYAKGEQTAKELADEIAGLVHGVTPDKKPIDVAQIGRDVSGGHAAHFATRLQEARNAIGGGGLSGIIREGE